MCESQDKNFFPQGEVDDRTLDQVAVDLAETLKKGGEFIREITSSCFQKIKNMFPDFTDKKTVEGETENLNVEGKDPVDKTFNTDIGNDF